MMGQLNAALTAVVLVLLIVVLILLLTGNAGVLG